MIRRVTVEELRLNRLLPDYRLEDPFADIDGVTLALLDIENTPGQVRYVFRHSARPRTPSAIERAMTDGLLRGVAIGLRRGGAS